MHAPEERITLLNDKKKGLLKSFLIYVLIIGGIFLIVHLVGTPKNTVKKLTYSELLSWIDHDIQNHKELEGADPEKTIKSVIIVENELVGITDKSAISDKNFNISVYNIYASIPSQEQFYADVNRIYEKYSGGESVSPTDYLFTSSVQQPEGVSWWVELLPILIMVVMFGGLMLFVMRAQTSGPNKGANSFVRGRTKLTDPSQNVTRFGDVAGADEEKEELKEVVDFLKSPDKYTKVGARIPHGVLLIGPPGTGKTLLAKAVAGEAGVPFFTISGSEFMEMYVGVGASRVRDLFEQAKKNAPAIIFIDEIDAIGRQRGAGLGGGHDEREQTLNQLLVEMDGFTKNVGVIVMAATNRNDILDPALLRPGRFDRQVLVNYPDIKGREEILKVHSRGKPLSKDVDIHTVAALTPYFTGADLANIMNEAALLTARNGKSEITMEIIEEAINRVSIGLQKKSHVVSPEDKNLVAYHEAGHAIVSYAIPECERVQEITTIPRGMAGGYTKYMPDERSHYVTSAKLCARIASSLGGHVAERIVFNDVTSGSTSDIKSATSIARSMVTEYGMSDLGPIFLSGEREVFLGKNFQQTSAGVSEDLNKRVDAEISRLLSEGEQRATQILTDYREKLDGIVKILLEKETINREEFESFMEDRPYDPARAEAYRMGKKPEEIKKEEEAQENAQDAPASKETNE
ncbi:MAG: ATP-dependent zinc metalloprotease FtsH [Clostridia bacterium]|nr:ATP-dependent zinc metalloprotease FtsH [Clostridia bacterium]